MSAGYKPVEGYVALQFIESESSAAPESSRDSMVTAHPGEPGDDGERATLALVVAAGPKCPAKAGDSVFVRPYARRGTHIDADTVIVETYCILAVVEK